jgi:hypothetical protein
MKVLSAAARKQLSATKDLPLHQTTMSLHDAAQALKQWNCHLPPHIRSIYLRLTRRLQYAKRRCETPTCFGWKHYGARGIKFKFKSTKAAVLWVMENLPHPTYKNLEIDRKNNNGHYAPGNLQLSTRRQNANNRSTTFWVPMKGKPLAMEDFKRLHPNCGYGRDQIRLLVLNGLTGEQIIKRFEAGRWKTAGQYKRGPRGKYKSTTS